MWIKSSLIIGLMTVITISTFSSLFVFAENSVIPDWVKNNAKWWYEGNIAEAEYISSLQFLIKEGIIKIQAPVTKVTATKVQLSDDERAKSFVVSFLGGDHFKEEVTIYTFVRFFHFSETVRSGEPSEFLPAPFFRLQSLPSMDKEILYDLVNRYVKAGKEPTAFDAEVDVITGNGAIIQTWEYRDCQIFDYSTFVNDDKDEYRFGEKDEAEVRESVVFKCAGFSLLTP